MPTKKFTAPSAAPEQPAKEPVEFDLEGARFSNNEPWSEHFACVEVAPPAVLDDLVSSSTIDERGNRIYHTPSLIAFMNGVLVDQDLPRFNALMRDKDRAIDIQTLGEIVVWISEEIVGRPTGP